MFLLFSRCVSYMYTVQYVHCTPTKRICHWLDQKYVVWAIGKNNVNRGGQIHRLVAWDLNVFSLECGRLSWDICYPATNKIWVIIDIWDILINQPSLRCTYEWQCQWQLWSQWQLWVWRLAYSSPLKGSAQCQLWTHLRKKVLIEM